MDTTISEFSQYLHQELEIPYISEYKADIFSETSQMEIY
jgi:hypothetical protein